MAAASNSVKSDSILAGTEIRHFHSDIVNEDFKLFVAHPIFPVAADQKLPLILALDGNTTFGLVVDTVRSISFEGAVPAALIVSIGYETEHYIPDAFAKRFRDLTPTKIDKIDQWGYAMVPGVPEQKFHTGGAPKFLQFIKEELFPYVVKEFNANVEDTLITGVSLGGLFASWVLFNDTQTFKRYLISSPSFWWDKEYLVKQAEDYILHKDDLPARVFMACGALERDEFFQTFIEGLKSKQPIMEKFYGSADGLLDANGQLKMAEYFEDFLPKLQKKGFPNLNLEIQIFEKETHGSNYGGALARGFRILYKE